jgi:cytochrome c biogenesis factor
MSSNLIRWCGMAAMLGGMLWIVAAIITASKPQGCIGPECDVLAMRDTSDVALLLLLALLLSAIGLAGMFIRARNTGRLDRWGQIGLTLSSVGMALLVLGIRMPGSRRAEERLLAAPGSSTRRSLQPCPPPLQTSTRRRP